jgi:hypothetical protein
MKITSFLTKINSAGDIITYFCQDNIIQLIISRTITYLKNEHAIHFTPIK